MATKRATKTSTLRALRSVNDAMRLAVGCVAQSSTGYLVRDEESGRPIRYVDEPLDDAKKIEHVDLAIRWLEVSARRIEVSRDYLFSYRARLVERSRSDA